MCACVCVCVCVFSLVWITLDYKGLQPGMAAQPVCVCMFSLVWITKASSLAWLLNLCVYNAVFVCCTCHLQRFSCAAVWARHLGYFVCLSFNIGTLSLLLVAKCAVCVVPATCRGSAVQQCGHVILVILCVFRLV